MSDPTMATLKRFNDPGQWDHVEEGVPIFCEHELWEVPAGDKTIKMAVLPDDEKPKQGKMLYRIDAERLRKTAAAINRNLNERGKPIKIFIGHTGNPLVQANQPELVGYSVGATVAPFGPKGRLGILTKNFYRKGKFDEAKEYPERSPEFHPITGDITGLALLKTDPKLPMGMVTYQRRDGTVLYGQGFEMDDDKDPGKDPKAGADAGDADGDPNANPGSDPTGAPDADALSPEEMKTADRYMRYYLATHPAMKHVAAKYAESITPGSGTPPAGDGPPPGNPPANPSPTNDDAPPDDDESDEGEADDDDADDDDEKKKGKVDMQAEALLVKYQQLEGRLATLEKSNQDLRAVSQQHVEKYAQAESKRLITGLLGEGFKITNPKKLFERMVKLNDQQRQELVTEIRENYAREDRAPVGGDFLPLADDVEGGPVEKYGVGESVDAARPDFDEVVAYMALHPGMSWEKAEADVQARKGKK